MRYENPLYMAEEAAAADLIAGGRLQLGVSRDSPEPALRGAETFGYAPPEGMDEVDFARRKTEVFRKAIAGAAVARADTGRPDADAAPPMLAIQPQAPGLAERIWWGSGTRATAEWAAAQGMNLQSSTLLTEDTGVPFDQLQAEQIMRYRSAWIDAGHTREPRVSVSRSVFPLVSDEDRAYFGTGARREGKDQLGYLDGGIARFGRSYIGEPDVVAEELSRDAAVRAADTLLLTIPNQLGVEYNARLLESIATFVAPAIGWSPAGASASA